MRALIVLGRVQTRRGKDPWPALDEALALARVGEIQELVATHAARAEAAWTAGHLATTAAEAGAGLELGTPSAMDWHRGELEFWAWKAGAIPRVREAAAPPYVLQSTGRLREAAAAWKEVGCPYQEALALADSDVEHDLRASLAIFRALGAGPAIRLVTSRLRRIGAHDIPRGPRHSTRRNPAGLTDRELEVLALLSKGLKNSEIASRLVVSAKTVDHHVSAILRKLDVPDRAAAAARAQRLSASQDGEVRAAR
jgi:DNA-binding CsgD family transcriptional regulator